MNMKKKLLSVLIALGFLAGQNAQGANAAVWGPGLGIGTAGLALMIIGGSIAANKANEHYCDTDSAYYQMVSVSENKVCQDCQRYCDSSYAWCPTYPDDPYQIPQCSYYCGGTYVHCENVDCSSTTKMCKRPSDGDLQPTLTRRGKGYTGGINTLYVGIALTAVGWPLAIVGFRL